MATIKSDNSDRIFKAIREALKKEVLVGIPASTATRAPSPGEPNPPSNALIGYVMETGEPAKNIPARPFLVPGVEAVQEQAAATTVKGIRGVFLGKNGAYESALHQVGLAAVVAVKQKMIAGPFAPLSDRTIEARARRRHPDTGKLVGAKSNREARQFLKLRGEGVPDEVLHDAGLAQPLIDTRSLITSITHVIRDKRDRS